MRKITGLICALFILLNFEAQAKKVYVKLNTDADAWTNVVQDADNVVVTLPAGDTKFNTALSSIALNDVVWVAKGVYTNNGAINMNTDRAGIKIYGGFKGDETTLESRRQIDSDGNGIIEPWEFEFVTQFKGDMNDVPSFRMFTMNSDNVVVDGITISDNNNTTDTGSGCYIKGVGATLSRCIVRNCITAWSRASNAVNGGGVFMENGTVIGCLIENCQNNNLATAGSAYGGGINLNGNACVIRNSTIRNNVVNSTQNALGGGLFINSGATAENCVIYNNNSSYRGGGVYVHTSGSDPVKLVNLTVVNNMAAMDGGGIFCNRGTTFIYNSIFWGNTNQAAIANNFNLNQVCYANANAFNGTQGLGVWELGKNSNPSPIEITLQPVNDLNVDYPAGLVPRFTRPTSFSGIGYDFIDGSLAEIAKANWTLQAGSDLIDKGVNSITNTPFTISTTDMMGHARPYGTNYDLGAYEFNGTTAIPSILETINYKFTINQNGVKVNGIADRAEVTAYNVVGAQINSSVLSDGETLKLNIHGVYLLKVTEKGHSQSYKFIY